ncbi:alcohol dehydrogenase catalytic domain-containing protein [Nesterenkonia sp. YGD6]|uniref:alcohol dehydrogenase catalytic domain-containing protein n=1 Tax=Nesterenkonia sp. YGD6 TaxID=2901231 RepID=UPI00406D04C3
MVIEVSAVGVCGTDLHIVEGEFAPSLPVLPGHEFAGVVVALGAEAGPARHGVRIGERMAASPELHCFACSFCRDGRFNVDSSGVVRTPMGDSISGAMTARTAATTRSAISGMLGSIPLDRFETPSDVPGVVSCPASPSAFCITGQSIAGDDGVWFS